MSIIMYNACLHLLTGTDESRFMSRENSLTSLYSLAVPDVSCTAVPIPIHHMTVIIVVLLIYPVHLLPSTSTPTIRNLSSSSDLASVSVHTFSYTSMASPRFFTSSCSSRNEISNPISRNYYMSISITTSVSTYTFNPPLITFAHSVRAHLIHSAITSNGC